MKNRKFIPTWPAQYEGRKKPKPEEKVAPKLNIEVLHWQVARLSTRVERGREVLAQMEANGDDPYKVQGAKNSLKELEVELVKYQHDLNFAAVWDEAGWDDPR